MTRNSELDCGLLDLKRFSPGRVPRVSVAVKLGHQLECLRGPGLGLRNEIGPQKKTVPVCQLASATIGVAAAAA